jgi:hypothetical protein
MVGGTCRGAAVFSLYFQRRPGGSYRPDLASVRKLWMVGGTCRGAAVFSLYFQRGNLRQSVLDLEAAAPRVGQQLIVLNARSETRPNGAGFFSLSVSTSA